MRVMMMSGNQITLPEEIICDFPGAECFDVTKENGRIVLTPVPKMNIDDIRKKLADRGITEADIADAVRWARGQGR